MPKYDGKNQIRFGVRFDTDKSSLQGVKKSLQEIQNIKPANFSGTEAQLSQIKQRASEVENALTKAFNVKLNTLNVQQFYKELGVADRNLDQVYADLSKIGGQGRATFNSLATSLTTTNTQLRESAGLLQNMGTTMMNTVKWGIASSVFNNITSSVQQAFQYVKSLDSALTDIRIVTGDSREEMAQFADQANRAAQSLGRSTMEYSKAALTYYQQGLSDQDVQARTEATLKAQNITGAGSQMADYLTAVWNGYKVANEEAQLYVDKLAAVADSSASNMSQLAIAMSKVASTANMLGVPVDSLNAQIATIVATTRQAPESVGNALKTIYARINDIATGADDAEISLGNYTSKMAELGVNVLDSNGKLRDTGDVIEQIGGKWQTLSREQQIYLARTMAGQRQYNNLLALFENWGKYTDLVNVSMDAQGATMEKNSRYMESLEAHLNQLGAASERLKAAMIDSDSFKGLIDFGTQAVQIFANFIEAIGGGGNALLMLGSIATQVFSGTIAKELGNIAIQARNNKQIYQQMQTVMQQTQIEMSTAAYKDPNNSAYKDYIDNLAKTHQAWSVLSQDERQDQQQRAIKIRTLAEEEQQLQKNVQAANNFAQAFGRSDVDFEHQIAGKIKNGIQQIQESLQQGSVAYKNFINSMGSGVDVSSSINNLKENIVELSSALGDKAPEGAYELALGLQQLRDQGDFTQQELDQLYLEIEKFYAAINNDVNAAKNFDQIKNKLRETKDELREVSTAFQSVNRDSRTVFDIQQVTKFLGVLGQCVAVLNSFANIGRIIKNDSLSLGEKILQISQVLISSGALIINIVKTTKQLFETTVARLAAEKGITRQKQKQAVIDAAQAKVNSAQAARKAFLGENGPWNKMKGPQRQEYQKLKQAADAAKAARKEALGADAVGDMDIFKLGLKDVGANISKFLTSPMKIFGAQLGISVGATLGWAAAIIAVGYAAYKIYNQAADAAKKAKENAEQAKEIYRATTQEVTNLRQGLDQLKSAKDNLKELTAGSNEWKDALAGVNQQVLELIDKFPQLKEYLTSENGQLGFKQGAQEQIRDLYAQRQATANITYAQLDSISAEATNHSMIVDEARELNPFGGQLSAKDLTEVVNAINKFGDDVLLNDETLEKNTDLLQSQRTLVLQHKAQIVKLAHEVRTNTQASKALSDAVTQSYITQSDQYQGLESDAAKQAFIKLSQNALNDTELNKSAYSRIDPQSGMERLNPRKLVERYNQLNGTQYKINFWGQIKDEDDKTVSQDIIETAVAMGDALENAGQMYRQQLQTINKLGDQGARIFSKFSKDNADVANLSQADFGNITGQLFNAIAQTMQLEDDTAVQAQLDKYKQRVHELSKEYINSLPRGIQRAFENIDTSKISLTAQQKIGDILNTAFVKGQGLENYQDELAKVFDNVIDKNKINDLFNLDLSDINSLDEFKDKISSITDVSNLSNQALQILYNSLKGISEQAPLTAQQLYSNIHSIIDKKNGKTLEYGDTLNQEDYNKLVEAGVQVDGFFQKLWDGTYMLIGAADEFYKQANKTSIQPLINEIKQLQQQVNNPQSFGNYNYQDLAKATYRLDADMQGGLPAFSAAEINYQAVQNQVDALQGIGRISDQDLANYQDLIKNQQMDLQTLQEIQKQIIQNKDALSNYNQEAKKNAEANLLEKQAQAAFSQQDIGQLRDLRGSGALDQLIEKDLDSYVNALLAVSDAEGLVKENIDAFAKSLISTAEELDWVDDSLQDNEKSSYEVAAAAEDLIVGIEGIQKAWKETNKEQVQAAGAGSQILAQTTQLISDMFNQDIDSSFITQHLEQIERIAQGDLSAVQDLGIELSMLNMENLSVDANINREQFDIDLANLQNELASTDWDSIKFGANIEDQAFYQALQQMLMTLGATQDQANEILAGIGYEPNVQMATIHLSKATASQDGTTYTVEGQLFDGTPITQVVTSDFYNSHTGQDDLTIPIIKGSKFLGGAGNLGRIGGARTVPKAPKSSGGGKGGGSNKSKTPTQAKITKPTAATQRKQQIDNPYEQVQKSYSRQEQQLKRLDKIEKNLNGKDRLDNLEKQEDVLKQQAKTLQKYLDISKSTVEGSTGYFRDLILKDKAFTTNEKGKRDTNLFDKDGQFKNLEGNDGLIQRSMRAYNNAVKKYDAELNKVQQQYNNWINNVYNKMSGQQQQAAEGEKKKWDDRLKTAQDKHKQLIKTEEQAYKKREDLINDYQDNLKKDLEKYEQYVEKMQAIIENGIEQTTYKLKLSLDVGDAERDYLDFENKVIKKLNKDDIFGNAQANFKKLTSYLNSGEIANGSQVINNIQKRIDEIQKANGGYSLSLGISREEWDNLKPEDQEALVASTFGQLQKELEEAKKTQMENLEAIQDQIDEIKEAYLDAIDDVNDKMDNQIEQYERVNDLIDHNIKMTQLLYGDKGYETLNKYYSLQEENNRKELDSLIQQQKYWQNRMNNQVVGSEAWKKFKENLDDVTDKLNDKVIEMMENAAKIFENRVSAAVDNINNRMTGGLGLDYVDEQWDYMSDYNDYFLDTFNTKTGIDQVTRAYQDALADSAGNPKQYQRINNLMQDQLKILKEKDKLTEYDLDRAKSLLEVEKARMALEDARNNKTKMRLRRDSQGNYTYQYVADEEKLGDLQDALADAQNNLYNQDKQHYKQNLNKLYDTYKDYIQKMKQLTEEYNATQDEEERARIQKRIDLLKESTSKMMEGLTDDNKYNLQYLTQSFTDGMGIDLSKYSPEEQMELLKENVPFVAGEVQKLNDKIVAEGGLLPATRDYVKELNSAVVQYDQDVKDILAQTENSVEKITAVVDENGNLYDNNITSAERLIEANDKLIKSCEDELDSMQDMLNLLDQYVNGVIDYQKLIAEIQTAQNTGYEYKGSDLKVDNEAIQGNNIDTTIGHDVEVSGETKQDRARAAQTTIKTTDYSKFMQDQMGIAWTDNQIKESTRSAFNTILDNIISSNFDPTVITNAVQQMTNDAGLSKILNTMGQNAYNMVQNTTNSDLSEQFVTINANFPDATSSAEIEQALRNLIAMAAMSASSKKG